MHNTVEIRYFTAKDDEYFSSPFRASIIHPSNIENAAVAITRAATRLEGGDRDPTNTVHILIKPWLTADNWTVCVAALARLTEHYNDEFLL